jgi:uncharacterized membrane protein
MAAMGRLRALLAFGLRALVVAMFVLALAETQTRQTSRAVSVVYLVDQRTSDQPFEDLADLQSYDTVVLANVARSSGSEAETLISDDQIEAPVRNTEMGCGLVMLGGPQSFGAGGWANTRRSAMPKWYPRVRQEER